MHRYLKSVGFSEIVSRTEFQKLVEDVVKNYDRRNVIEKEDGSLSVEMSKEYAYDCGVTVYGELDEEDKFHFSYCYPFFSGSRPITEEDISIEEHAENESFSGAVDDYRVGITLIFYLQNPMDYLLLMERGDKRQDWSGVTLSGLANDGIILLPVYKEKKEKEAESKFWQQRNAMLLAAKDGDEDAIQSLTMEDIDTYSEIARRINRKEDVLSIVDSYLMPYGLECDKYSILGEIIQCDTSINAQTKEKLHILSVKCNDIPIDICINDRDLTGIPEVGRRFRGVIWLQGKVDFL